MEDLNLSHKNRPAKIDVNDNMLLMLVLNRVGGQVYNINVVTFDKADSGRITK